MVKRAAFSEGVTGNNVKKRGGNKMIHLVPKKFCQRRLAGDVINVALRDKMSRSLPTFVPFSFAWLGFS